VRFLVVGKSPMVRRIVVNALARIGYPDSVEACDTADGLAKLDDSIGFVIVDWELLGLSGPAFVGAVRSGSHRAVHVMAVNPRDARTADAGPPAAGVSTTIAKPFAPSVLKEKIDHVLASAGAAA
jgi:DNA-binding response OmpR family regulator